MSWSPHFAILASSLGDTAHRHYGFSKPKIQTAHDDNDVITFNLAPFYSFICRLPLLRPHTPSLPHLSIASHHLLTCELYSNPVTPPEANYIQSSFWSSLLSHIHFRNCCTRGCLCMRLCLHFCTRYELTRSGTMDAEHVNGLHSGDTRAVLDRHGNLSFLINWFFFFLSLVPAFSWCCF